MNCACEVCGHVVTVVFWPPTAYGVVDDCPTCGERREFYPTDRVYVPHPYDAVGGGGRPEDTT
jgi:hypothetical protein